MSDSKEDIAASDAAPNVGYDQKNDVHQAPLHFPAKDELAHTKSMNEVIHNAKTATDKEHSMTLWQGIKLYPKAVGWSLLISTCICMEGYDVCLLSNFCKSRQVKELYLRGYANVQKDGFPQFNKKYGQQLSDGTYQVPAPWQAGLSNVSVHAGAT